MLKRALSLYIFITVSFMALLGRIIYIQHSSYSEASYSKGSRTLVVGERRGIIYDRNFTRLTENDSRLLAVVTPCAGAYDFLKEEADNDYLKKKIEDGYPFICEVKNPINNEYIRTFSVTQRYSADSAAPHLIGYCSSDGQEGVIGIEKAFNAYLKESGGRLSVSFDIDAVGRVLAGMDKRVNDSNYSGKGGVVLTLDERVQRIAEKVLENSSIKSGCAVVMHVHTGEILAMASVPRFNQNDIAASLNEDNSPLVNKAMTAYSVGSVFKPLVAAAALECGIDDKQYFECAGEITVGNRVFSCYKNEAHGKIDMTGALENSCNTYFINLIMQADTSLLLRLCRETGFGASDEIAPDMLSAKGSLPTEEELKIKGNLANLAFGQGKLTATPLQITKAYHTLATGNYIEPQLILGFTNFMGLMTKAQASSPKKLLKDETVSKLREMLESVTEKGKADNAHSSLVKTAGKTGTAQSGIYFGDKEVLRTWFAGFFPAGNPHYIVVVMNENGIGGNTDCAPVFKEICERIISN